MKKQQGIAIRGLVKTGVTLALVGAAVAFPNGNRASATVPPATRHGTTKKVHGAPRRVCAIVRSSGPSTLATSLTIDVRGCKPCIKCTGEHDACPSGTTPPIVVHRGSLGVVRGAFAPRSHPQLPLHPALFALAPAAFPAGSLVVRAGIESNQQLLRDQQRHFGVPPAALGRQSGYYMDAVEGEPSAVGPPYTAYLVSIFHAVRQARLAYAIRWETWFVADYFTSPSPAPGAVGDPGAVALFQSLDPSTPPESELLFRRGAILVEVFQGTSRPTPTASERQAFWAIATTLDAVAAAHPRGA